MKHIEKGIAVFAIFVLLGVFVSCKSTKRGGAVTEYRYGRAGGDKAGYTFYRFYGNDTFSRGAYGRDGSKSGEIETERGTYSGDAAADGTLTLTVTSTFNALGGTWLSVSAPEAESGKIAGDTFEFNGIRYVRYDGKNAGER
ncbi:hypothetical protein [Treponema socranskii]|uniref:hypothetical protein n=1 Tax=Treponema socranskii TaxID=53419 RepID=UPI003D8C00FA